MRRLLPDPVIDVDLDALAVHYAYPESGSVRANMVASLDGAVTVEGRSGGLSGDADRRVFRILRALADVVLVGAGTARSEDYGPARVPPELAGLRDGQDTAPTIAVVTRTAELDPSARLFGEARSRPVVLTCRAAPPSRVAALQEVADVVAAGDDDVDLPAALARLADRGWTRILCEGGPSLLGALTAADLVDELTLTLAPLLVAGDAGRITVGPVVAPREYALAGLLAADDVLLAHYRRNRR